jgi:serine/threonine-protein kinase RsbW
VAQAFENEGAGHPASGDRVVLTIPSKPQYIGLCRLALAALASRDQLPEDVAADLKIAVSEACALFVPLAEEEGSVNGGAAHLEPSASSESVADVTISYALFDDHWAVEVSGASADFPRGEIDDPTSERALGITIIQALVDQLDLPSPEAATAVLRLVKQLG